MGSRHPEHDRCGRWAAGATGPAATLVFTGKITSRGTNAASKSVDGILKRVRARTGIEARDLTAASVAPGGPCT